MFSRLRFKKFDYRPKTAKIAYERKILTAEEMRMMLDLFGSNIHEFSKFIKPMYSDSYLYRLTNDKGSKFIPLKLWDALHAYIERGALTPSTGSFYELLKRLYNEGEEPETEANEDDDDTY